MDIKIEEYKGKNIFYDKDKNVFYATKRKGRDD